MQVGFADGVLPGHACQPLKLRYAAHARFRLLTAPAKTCVAKTTSLAIPLRARNFAFSRPCRADSRRKDALSASRRRANFREDMTSTSFVSRPFGAGAMMGFG